MYRKMKMRVAIAAFALAALAWPGVCVARLDAVIDYEPLIRKAEHVVVVRTGKVDGKAFTAELAVIRALKGDATGTLVLDWSALGLRGRMERSAYPQEGDIAVAALTRAGAVFRLDGGRFLASGLTSPDDVQVAVFDTYCRLVKLGEATAPGVEKARLELLRTQAKEDRWQYRYAALNVAAEKVPAASRGELVVLLLQALKDSEPKVVAEAIRDCALSKWCVTEAADPILAILNAEKRPDWEVLEAALRRVGGLDAGKAFDTLVRFAGDRSGTVREAAVFGLMFGRDKKKIEPLLKAMRDSNGLVRARACEALENVPDKRVVPALIEALVDPEGAVRQPAFRVLESWTGQRLGYNPNDPLHLDATVAEWRKWWARNEGTVSLPDSPKK
jgi:hypothetical protein